MLRSCSRRAVHFNVPRVWIKRSLATSRDTVPSSNASARSALWFAAGVTSAAATYAAMHATSKDAGNTGNTRATASKGDSGGKTAIQQAFKELQEVLPPEHVTVDEDILRHHGYSSNSYHNEGCPNIVVYPRNTQEVVEIVKIANRLR